MRDVRANLKVVRHKLYPVGGVTRRGSRRGKDFLVLLVVPEIGNFNVHVHGRVAGIDRGKIKLEWNTRLKSFHHLGRRQSQRLRMGMSRKSSQAGQPAEQAA